LESRRELRSPQTHSQTIPGGRVHMFDKLSIARFYREVSSKMGKIGRGTSVKLKVKIDVSKI
jgi:hypothetical protein